MFKHIFILPFYKLSIYNFTGYFCNDCGEMITEKVNSHPHIFHEIVLQLKL